MRGCVRLDLTRGVFGFLCFAFLSLGWLESVAFFEGFLIWFLGTDVLLRSIIPFAHVVCYAMDFV